MAGCHLPLLKVPTSAIFESGASVKMAKETRLPSDARERDSYATPSHVVHYPMTKVWISHALTDRQTDRQTDSLYFSTMILKAMQLVGSCINTNLRAK